MQPYIKKFDSSTEYYFQEGCYITEISNSDDDPGLSIARARVVPGVTTKLHKLIDTIERYVILEGAGLIELSDEGNQKVKQEVVANDVVIIPAQCGQRITNTGKTDLVFLAICTPPFKNRCYKEV
jgi:mannose-6-phosphate isomerase-like protein (cupin superfamily)